MFSKARLEEISEQILVASTWVAGERAVILQELAIEVAVAAAPVVKDQTTK